MASELKKRAMLAKQRMKMGYWQELSRKRNNLLQEVGNTANNLKIICEAQREEISRNANIVINNSQASLDEALYLKVKDILDEDEFLSNPIGRLIDEEKIKVMDERSKEKYVLELGQKYRELKERYFKERMINSVMS